MAKKTKKQMRIEIEKVWKKLYPRRKVPAVLDKVYEICGTELSKGPLNAIWESIFNRIARVECDSAKYFVRDCVQDIDQLEDADEFKLRICGELVAGKHVVKILDNLRAQLGPDPKNALVFVQWSEGIIAVAREADPSCDELSHILFLLQNELDRQRQREKEVHTQESLSTIIEKLGFDTALRVLKAASKERK
jgi:hypothetical protein